jgi:glycosyltransferase involved in cell wall biosynthesis
LTRVRICLVYDCLYPWTVGGAERWYRQLGERLARDGHEVTYLTLRQWDRHERPEVEGVQVVPVGPRLPLYTADGRRRIGPPLVFAAGVLWHLLRHGRRYEVVHTASFPYFSVLAAALVRPVARYRIVCDWHEVWSRSYWREYLGRMGGWMGWCVQLLCARVGQRAFCFSQLHAERLRELGVRGEVGVLRGEYDGSLRPGDVDPAAEVQPVAVFAGRHIPEKRAPAAVRAIAEARHRMPELRGEILGDGPEREQVLRLIEELGLRGIVEAPGFVSAEELDAALGKALCLLLPSSREGYGLVVVEAAARGTPSVVVRAPDNAATELVEDGVNGLVVDSAEPGTLGGAIATVHSAGEAMRRSTAGWFGEHYEELSLSSSLDRVAASYAA